MVNLFKKYLRTIDRCRGRQFIPLLRPRVYTESMLRFYEVTVRYLYQNFGVVALCDNFYIDDDNDQTHLIIMYGSTGKPAWFFDIIKNSSFVYVYINNNYEYETFKYSEDQPLAAELLHHLDLKLKSLVCPQSHSK